MAGRREDLEIVIGADLGGLAADLAKSRRMVDTFGRDVGRNMPKAGDFKPSIDAKGFRDISAHAKKASVDVNGTATSLVGLAMKGGMLVASVAGAATGLVMLGAAAKTLKESVTMAAQVEQTTLAFDVMLSSAQRAQEMVSGLRKFAAETPFNSREVTVAGKQLLAYGVAANQIIPTLRMLGDVSAAFGEDLPLKDLTYLYGTLFAQQRAYAVDIKQFAGRGIPIYEELAKVIGKSVAEVKDLVEEGRIGRDEVTQAFLSMTSAGGKFFNMTRRQADTLLGSWEQMTDAFDLAKIKLGQILIRDLGLKEVVKNSEAFGNTIEQNLERLSPYIKTLGNLGHAVGNVAVEINRAALQGANFAAVLADSAFPEVREAAMELGKEIDALIQKGAEVKIKPVLVAGALFHVADELAGVFIDTLKGIRDIGSALRESIVRPIGESFEVIRSNYNQFMIATNRGPEGDTYRYRLPGAFEKDEDIISRYRALNAEWERVSQNYREAQKVPVVPGIGFDSAKAIEPNWRRLDDLHREWLNLFAAPKDHIAAQDALLKGRLPGVFPGRATWGNEPGRVSGVIAQAETRRDQMRATGARFILELAAKELAAEMNKAADATKRNNEIRDVVGQLGIGAALGPYGRFMAPPPGAAIGQPKPAGVQLMGDLSPGAADLKKALRERYDPLNKDGELMRRKADLDELLKRNLISPQLHQLGWRDAAKEVADRMGAGDAPRLVDAVTAGSQDDARLLSNFFAGQQRQTTDDLLKQIRDILSAKLGAIAAAPVPRPVSVAPAGGG